jgi:RimJ/RimL family protein N-acetyltransferase
MSSRIVYGEDERVAAWVAERAGQTRVVAPAAIGLERDGRLIAGVSATEHWPGADLNVNIAAEPGSAWASRRFLRALFAYPFVQLGVPRVTARVLEGNAASHALCKRLGFQLEGVMRRATPGGDNVWIYGMLRDECIWLKGVRV